VEHDALNPPQKPTFVIAVGDSYFRDVTVSDNVEVIPQSGAASCLVKVSLSL